MAAEALRLAIRARARVWLRRNDPRRSRRRCVCAAVRHAWRRKTRTPAADPSAAKRATCGLVLGPRARDRALRLTHGLCASARLARKAREAAARRSGARLSAFLRRARRTARRTHGK